MERYNRLRCEFSELLEQVAEQQNKATESEKASKHIDSRMKRMEDYLHAPCIVWLTII